MKPKLIVWTIFLFALGTGVFLSCSTPGYVSERSGAQLWGENCLRCHNAPAPNTFSDVEWDVAVMHMRVRAYLTHEEATKIADFLKTAN